MLSTAREMLADGQDVLVGGVDPRGRPALERLLEGLPGLPTGTEDGKRESAELDLDAALERRPRVLLLDCLAYANPSGRHPKRWADVQELLAAGISVHTTLDVGSLESLAEVVAGMTGMAISETVPDKVLEQAEIVLIDLPPDALLARLEAGKLYPAAQAHRARQELFQKNHLLALRELAVRKAAQLVDSDARHYLSQHSQAGPWPVGERLLVCVGPSPYSERLVRATKRLADAMSAGWIALHVDTGNLSAAAQQRVDRHLQLAQRLGAEVVTETSHSLVEQVLQTVAARNVSKVVTGRTPALTSLQGLFFPSLADAVLRRAQAVDVLVLAGDESEPERAARGQGAFSPRPYLTALLLVVLATLLAFPLAGMLNPTTGVILYLAAVVATAYRYGPGPSSAASLLSVLAFNYIFVHPRYSLSVTEASYWVTFLGLLLTGLLISRLTALVKEQSRSAQLREADALTLLALSRDLAQAASREELVESALRHLSKTFGPVRVLLEQGPGKLQTVAGLDARELEVAERALRDRSAAGKGTGTLPEADYQWHPLRGPTRTLGVAGLGEAVALGARRREDLLEAILNQVSAALERRDLLEAAQQAELLRASEKLHAALLSSVSHDLRIPLVSIQGALTTLGEKPDLLDEARRRAVIANALSETDRLNRLVENLLQKTRLETGHLTLKPLLCDVEDLVATTLSSLSHRLEGRSLAVEIAPDLPLVPMDFVLIAQVLTNLLENALAYSEPGTPLEVGAWQEADRLYLQVRDRGVGLGSIAPEGLFEPFTRGDVPGSGVGLGLSICRGLVEAHQGSLFACSREGGGAVFTFTLPLEVSHAGSIRGETPNSDR